MATLAGYLYASDKSNPWTSPNDHDCDDIPGFVLKLFSAAGYSTMYNEDTATGGTSIEFIFFFTESVLSLVRVKKIISFKGVEAGKVTTSLNKILTPTTEIKEFTLETKTLAKIPSF